MTQQREGELKGRIALFERVSANFKQTREELLERRRVAEGRVLAEIAKQMETNERVIEGFERSLSEVRELLRREASEK